MKVDFAVALGFRDVPLYLTEKSLMVHDVPLALSRGTYDKAPVYFVESLVEVSMF